MKTKCIETKVLGKVVRFEPMRVMQKLEKKYALWRHFPKRTDEAEEVYQWRIWTHVVHAVYRDAHTPVPLSQAEGILSVFLSSPTHSSIQLLVAGDVIKVGSPR
jgi:hypothetical protein